MDDKQQTNGAENPEKLTGLKKGRIKKNAAGIPAVVNSLQQVFSEAGVIRGSKHC